MDGHLNQFPTGHIMMPNSEIGSERMAIICNCECTKREMRQYLKLSASLCFCGTAGKLEKLAQNSRFGLFQHSQLQFLQTAVTMTSQGPTQTQSTGPCGCSKEWLVRYPRFWKLEATYGQEPMGNTREEHTAKAWNCPLMESAKKLSFNN